MYVLGLFFTAPFLFVIKNVTILNHTGMTRRVMPRMNSDGYFCVVLIADVRHMSKNRCLWQRFCEWDGRVLNSYLKTEYKYKIVIDLHLYCDIMIMVFYKKLHTGKE